MRVTVHLKDGRSFTYGETAVFEDKEAGWFVLGLGKVSGGRYDTPGSRHVAPYRYDDDSHIAYSYQNVDRIEIRDKDPEPERQPEETKPVYYWPRAVTEDGEQLFTYDSVFTKEKALNQFSIWQDHYGYKITEAWIDTTDGKRIDVRLEKRWTEVE